MKSLKIVVFTALFFLLGAGALEAEEVSRHQLGDYEVICLNENSSSMGDEILRLPASAKLDELRGQEGWNQGGMNYFVVDTGGKKLLFDAGNPGGNTVKMLAKAGLAPADINVIFLTHLHPDHVGGLLDENGRKVFPNAKMYVGREEAAYWSDTANSGQWFELARQVLEAYKADITLFEQNQSLEGVESIPTFGHTPGHTSFQVNSQGRSLCIWGDIVHVAGQFANPEIYVTFDVDPVQAVKTRKMIMERIAGSGEAVAGMHILASALGQVQKEGDGYKFVPGL